MIVFLRRNLAWMLLAMALSTALWTIVTTQQNPDVIDVFQAIPVEVRNVPGELMVRNDVAPVRLVVAAPRDVWSELRPAKFQAWVDLSRVGPGLQEVPIQIQTIDPRAKIEDVTPQKAIVHLEPIRRKEIPTRVRTVGDLPAGYLARPPKTTPEVIMISGPQSTVEQVTAAVADVELSGITSSISQAYKVVAHNANGERVERLTLSSENVLVEIRVEQERAIKTVPVAPQVTGAPAPGYQLVGLRVDPTAITLEGDPRTMEPIDFIATQVDLNNATGDLSVNATLQLPNGVRLARQQPIVVRAFVSPIEGSKAIEVAPSVLEVRPGLRASIEPGAVRLTLLGPMPLLNTVGPRDVRITANASGLGPGQHQLRPRIEAPPLVRVSSTEPERVDVRIVEVEPTPTVQPTVTSTPVRP